MTRDLRLGPLALVALFAIGAVGGLIGDMCHVESGTTVYLDDGLPYVWDSQLWFPLMVGAGTAALGWIRVRLGESGGGDPENARDVVAMVAAILALYALTAIVRGEPQPVAIVLVYGVAALICARFARGPSELACGALAALFGVGTEIALAGAGVFEYAADVDQVVGVAAWLPGLYVAYGVVAARLGIIASSGEPR